MTGLSLDNLYDTTELREHNGRKKSASILATSIGRNNKHTTPTDNKAGKIYNRACISRPVQKEAQKVADKLTMQHTPETRGSDNIIQILSKTNK